MQRMLPCCGRLIQIIFQELLESLHLFRRRQIFLVGKDCFQLCVTKVNAYASGPTIKTQKMNLVQVLMTPQHCFIPQQWSQWSGSHPAPRPSPAAVFFSH